MVFLMARLLSRSQSVLRHSVVPSSPFKISWLIPTSFALGHRNRSTRSGKVKFIEIDLESSSVSLSSSSGGESEVLAIKKLDDVVQMIMVQRSTPDWLPFVPGSSFWVPPRRTKPLKVVDLFDKLAEPLTGEESRSFITARGWPSSDFFTKDSGTHLTPVDVELETLSEVESEMEVKVPMITDNSNHPDDEER